jgi:hypothetical protein
MGTKSRRTEHTIVRVIAFYCHTNVRSFSFKEHLAAYCITGGSGQLVIDKEEGTAMIHIDGTTGVTICGGAVT